MSTTSTWNSSGSPRAATWRTYTNDWRDGSEVDRVYQGQYSTWGHNRGLWFFDDANIRSTLSGKRILSIKILIQRHWNNHGVYSAQTPTLRLHNYSSQPSGVPTMGSGDSGHGVSFALGDQKWVPLHTSWGDALRDGSARGLGLYTTSNTPYMYFYGSATLSITHEPLLNAPPTPSGFYMDSSTTSSVAMSCNTAGSSANNNLATLYRWDREGGGTGTSSGTSFNNTGLSAGLTDRWRVRAENSAGVSSYTGWMTGRTKPAVPGSLRQTAAETNTVTATWNSTTGATLYRLRRSNGSEYTGTATSDVAGSLAAGTTYSMQVRAEVPVAYGTGGAGAYSSYVSMTTLPVAPGTPTASSITHTSVALSWGAVTGATSYIVQRKTGAAQFATVRTQTGTTWTDTSLSPGTTYDYRVAAVSAGGEGAYSETRTISTVALPATPTGLAVGTVQSYSIALSWNVVSGAASYTLQRLSSTGTVLASFSTTNPTYTDAGVLPGGSYQYRVRAESSLGGVSDYSLTESALATPLAQVAPSTIGVPNYDASGSMSFGWSFNTGNIEDGQTAYELEIRRVSDDVRVHHHVGTTQSSRLLTGGSILNDENYKWRVRTKDSFAVGFSDWSTYKSFYTVTLPTVLISSPLDNDLFQLSTSPTIPVSWTYSQAASTPQDGFRVTAKLAGITTFDSGWISSVASTYDIAGLTNGTYDITVQVRARGVVGGTDTATSIGVTSKTVTLRADTSLVYWSATAGPGGTPGFVFATDATVGERQYHIAPRGDGWNMVAENFQQGDEEWASHKTVDYPAGTNIILTLVANINDDFGGTMSSDFGIVLEYDDDTVEYSFIMNVYSQSTIRTPVDTDFDRFTTSILARKRVVGLQVIARFDFMHDMAVTPAVISSLSVARAGRLYSQEYVDTGSQRGLLLTGSGYVQGTELSIQAYADSQATTIIDNTISLPGGSDINVGGYGIGREYLQLSSPNNTAGTRSRITLHSNTAQEVTNAGKIVMQPNLGAGEVEIQGQATVIRPGVGPQLRVASDGTSNNYIAFYRNGLASPRTGYIGNSYTTSDHLNIISEVGADVRLITDAAIRLYGGYVVVHDDFFQINQNGTQSAPSLRMAAQSDNGFYGSSTFVAVTTGGTYGQVWYDTYTLFNKDVHINSRILAGSDTVSDSTGSGGFYYGGVGSYCAISRATYAPLHLNRIGSNGEVLGFRRSGSVVGGVHVTTTSTSYATSSDYRLKTNDTEIAGVMDKVMALRPIEFDWVDVDEPRTTGFFAHEVAAIIPGVVQGEKDAVDDEGKPDYQSMDHSKLVPLLTAAVQELSTELDAVKVELAALR